MGEHAVVHGKPALIAAINRRLAVTVTDSERLQIDVSDTRAGDFIRYALEQVRLANRLDQLPPLAIRVTSQFPFGYHLGSSAALAVATVGAVTYFIKQLWNPVAINQTAYGVEKKQHGNPSGGDNTTCTFGGFLWFRKELDFLRSIWQLPLTIPAGLNNFYLVDTGKPEETTGEMVAYVQQRLVQAPRRMAQCLDRNERATRAVATALKTGDGSALQSAIQEGEASLETMGVVSPYARRLIRGIAANGGTAKILGGGGRKKGVGYLLCYVTDAGQLARWCSREKLALQPVQLGGEGVRLETGKHG